MDFSFTPQQEALRQEIRTFLAGDDVQTILQEVHQRPFRQELFSRKLYGMLADRGWLALHWPAEYGGGGKTMIETGIVTEEMARAGVPTLVWGLTVGIFGNAVLLLGTEEQKQKYLTPIARGEMLCNVLYTEPDAGSDLASLRARAIPGGPDGNEWIVNGTKIFNSAGHLADHGLIVVRTDPDAARHRGLTLFIVDMHAPGVTVRPMWTMSDERLNEVSLENVRVPAENMIGAPNEGWILLNAALAIERTGLDLTAITEKWLDAVIALVKEKGLGSDRYIRQKIAEFYSELQVARLLGWRVISSLARGEVNDVYSAMSKMYGTELGKHIVRLGMEIGGLEALLTRWDGDPLRDGLMEAYYRQAPGWTIAAGTTEIMLYLIAYRGLRVHK
jgi:alkylation response protein AidB-like acyl-CoA dehydrogenase